jgi:hypothetical protein
LKKYTHICAKGSPDMLTHQNQCIASAVMCLQDFTRLLFNYLRVSPNYWLVTQQSGHIRLHKNMHPDQRAAIKCYRRYGDVYNQGFDTWDQRNARHWQLPQQRKVELLSGVERERIQDQDAFVHLPWDAELPSAKQLHELLAAHRAKQAVVAAADQPRIRLTSLWKILHLVYTRAMHPDIEQWRVGAMVKLVKEFAHELDPWGARSKRGVEQMRRHMNLMVRRWLDRGAVIAANAACGLFPNDEGHVADTDAWRQIRFDFEDSSYLQQLFAQGHEEMEFVSDRALGALG